MKKYVTVIVEVVNIVTDKTSVTVVTDKIGIASYDGFW